MENVELKEMTPADLEFVKEVYDYYILHSTAVFYLHPLTISELGENIRLGDPRYLAYTIHTNNQRCGFCYISKFKPKEAFDVTVEITVYLTPSAGGKGIGYAAMQQFEPRIWEAGFHNIVALITGENTASVRLFEKCGYTECARIKQVARKFDRLLDLLIYQKLCAS